MAVNHLVGSSSLSRGAKTFKARLRKDGPFLGAMPFWVYILRSESTGRHYCTSTSDVKRRLRQHNDPDYRLSKTTKRFQGPWALLWSEECITRGESMRLERQIKKRGVSRYLLDIQIAATPFPITL